LVFLLWNDLEQKKTKKKMLFKSLIVCIFPFLLRMKQVVSFAVDFSPLTPMTLQPAMLPLCGNCKEAMIVGEGRSLACRLFGKTDVIWGTVDYKACTVARRNESMCGTEGRYYYRREPFEKL